MTQSSTEAKLVGVNDAMTLVMWAKYFFEEDQVKLVEESSKIKKLGTRVIIEQDNTSAIQMERYWKRFCV